MYRVSRKVRGGEGLVTAIYASGQGRENDGGRNLVTAIYVSGRAEEGRIYLQQYMFQGRAGRGTDERV
jgi:hypothetical protein